MIYVSFLHGLGRDDHEDASQEEKKHPQGNPTPQRETPGGKGQSLEQDLVRDRGRRGNRTERLRRKSAEVTS